MEFSKKNTAVGSHSLLQRIFPTQGLKSGLLHCRCILYHLSHSDKLRRRKIVDNFLWYIYYCGFPDGEVVKNLPANAGVTEDVCLILRLRRSLGVGNGNLLQYPCLENSMDRRAWWAIVHGVAKSQTWLSLYKCTNIALTIFLYSKFSSVQFRCSVMSDSATPGTAARQASLSITNSWVYPNSSPLSWWCHPTNSSSGFPFFSHLQSFPAWGSFPMSQFFTSGGQSIGVSASTSVLPMNTQDWIPLGWTGWISLQSKELSRVFSNTTVQKHQFFSAQLSV